MGRDKAVVLSSGGLNSTVATMMAKAEGPIALLHVKFDHRAASREYELFERQVEFFGVEDHLAVEMPHLQQIGGNGRVNKKYQIEAALAIGEGTSNAYIPGLICTMLGVGFTWASVIGASRIYLGVSEDLGPPAPRTNSIYPDYSREHVELCKHAFNVATLRRPINVEAPVIDLSRAEIVKIGYRLGAPFDLTWSCISSGTEPCGACVGCATRNRGFLDAAIPDPVICETSNAT